MVFVDSDECISGYLDKQDGNKIKFELSDSYKQFKCPFSVIIDFEAFPVNIINQNKTDKTSQRQKHKACSDCAKVQKCAHSMHNIRQVF